MTQISGLLIREAGLKPYRVNQLVVKQDSVPKPGGELSLTVMSFVW